MRFALALLLAAGARAEPAADSDAAPDVETLVVTATHDPLPLARAPGSVDVVSGDELERGHYDGVLEALRHRPASMRISRAAAAAAARSTRAASTRITPSSSWTASP